MRKTAGKCLLVLFERRTVFGTAASRAYLLYFAPTYLTRADPLTKSTPVNYQQFRLRLSFGRYTRILTTRLRISMQIRIFYKVKESLRSQIFRQYIKIHRLFITKHSPSFLSKCGCRFLSCNRYLCDRPYAFRRYVLRFSVE